MLKKLITIIIGWGIIAVALAQTPAQFVAPNINITGGVITNLNTPLSTANGGTGGNGPYAGDARLYVSTSGSDSNAGTSIFSPYLHLQTAVNALASTGGTIEPARGTYVLPATLHMYPNVRINCIPGTVITQAAGANLTQLVEFATNSANGASINGCTIDGARSTNTDNANDIMVYIGSANDVTLTNNSLQNGNGSCVNVGSGLRPNVSFNKINNFYVGGYYAATGVSNNPTYGKINYNIIGGNIGQHAITFNNSDFNTAIGNTIAAPVVVGMAVNTSGTTVTWVSGTNFSSFSPGNFIILNGGSEYLITAVNSSTSLTINSSAGTLSGVSASYGPGDLISILAGSNNLIGYNTITGGVGGGVVISNFVGGESTQKNLVIGNILHAQAEGCIELESENTFSTQVFDNQILSNNISDCGVGGASTAANTQYGIALIDFNPNTLLNTFIDGNYVRDDQGTHTTKNWLGISSLGVGQVYVGHNTGVTTANVGVAGGISSVTLGSGWGSSATVTATSMGDSFFMTITSAGTGQAAYPSVTVNTVATTADNPPVMTCQFTGGTGTIQQTFGQTPITNTSPSVVLFFYNGTPTASQTYSFLCRG